MTLTIYAICTDTECPFYSIDFAGFHSCYSFPFHKRNSGNFFVLTLLQFTRQKRIRIHLLLLSRKISRTKTIFWLCDFAGFNAAANISNILSWKYLLFAFSRNWLHVIFVLFIEEKKQWTLSIFAFLSVIFTLVFSWLFPHNIDGLKSKCSLFRNKRNKEERLIKIVRFLAR